jgi:micrococcal nuclease
MRQTPARVLTVGLLALALAATAMPAAAQPRPVLGYVTRAVDGDTVYAEVGGRIEAVRYIGVSTPVIEHPTRGREPYAATVREMNRRLVEGKWIRLVFEDQPRDQHDRLLAYVWVGKIFVNAALAHWGFAEATAPGTYPRYAAYFRGLEDGARRDRRGLWRYGEALAYHHPGGAEAAGNADYQQRAATAAGGRVFSAPAPFIPSFPPSGGGTPSTSSSVGVPATAAPPATTSRGGSGYMPRGGTSTTR